jgi:hypothetical protein
VVGHIARWLRDEEAAGSNPATPTQVKGHSPKRDVAFSYAVQRQSTATPTSQAASQVGHVGRYVREPATAARLARASVIAGEMSTACTEATSGVRAVVTNPMPAPRSTQTSDGCHKTRMRVKHVSECRSRGHVIMPLTDALTPLLTHCHH